VLYLSLKNVQRLYVPNTFSDNSVKAGKAKELYQINLSMANL